MKLLVGTNYDLAEGIKWICLMEKSLKHKLETTQDLIDYLMENPEMERQSPLGNRYIKEEKDWVE